MPLLEIRDLTKRYASPDGGVQTVLDVPHFSLEAGQHLALAGRSGSGKTTFLNTIAGILAPESGSVVFDGTELLGLGESGRDRWRAQNLGYVFQTFNLLQGYSALENVLLGMMFGPGSDRAWAQELLERLGLSDRMHHRPGQLSIGQQQRVAVARALANRPRLVLADEPTGNLDPSHAKEALGLMRDLAREQNAALLVVSHDESVLTDFDDRLDLSEINRASRASVTSSTPEGSPA